VNGLDDAGMQKFLTLYKECQEEVDLINSSCSAENQCMSLKLRLPFEKLSHFIRTKNAEVLSNILLNNMYIVMNDDSGVGDKE
jgi:hypothetical protein